MRHAVSFILMGAASLSSSAMAAAPVGIEIRTDETVIDDAVKLAVRTLTRNVSEKWGTICPVLAPAWARTYPAWIHPFDNFWMNKVTVYLFDAQQVAWPIQLFAKYQYPTGMIAWGVHDCPSPEVVQAKFAEMSPEELRDLSLSSRYIRDHLFVMQVCDLWMATGDKSLLEALLPHCRRSIEYLFTLKDSDGDGLVESADIIEDIDVSQTGEPSGPNDAERFVDQCLTYGALLDFARMCEAVGDPAAAAEARARSARIKKLSNDLFWHEKGYYVFAIDTKTGERLHEVHTSTYANGYAILFGLADPQQTEAILDYMESWSFKVPGPILIPPLPNDFVHAGRKFSFPPGVYANGGCGWGRGHLPSVTRANFRMGRVNVGLGHLRAMAEAANKAGAFYEYWTWEKYAGKTEPGGCRDYSETASAFLDATIHGLFGIEPSEPGFATVRVAPRFPAAWKTAAIRLPLPAGSAIGYGYVRTDDRIEISVSPGGQRRFKLSICTWDRPAVSVTVNGKGSEFTTRTQRDLHLCEFECTAAHETTIRVSFSGCE